MAAQTGDVYILDGAQRFISANVCTDCGKYHLAESYPFLKNCPAGAKGQWGGGVIQTGAVPAPILAAYAAGTLTL